MSAPIPFENEADERQLQIAIAASLATAEDVHDAIRDVQDAIRASMISQGPVSMAQIAQSTSGEEQAQQSSSQQVWNSKPQQWKPAQEICDGSQVVRKGKLTRSLSDDMKTSQNSSANIAVPPVRRSIDDAILDLQQRRNDLPRLYVPCHDTWVFINPPAQLPDQDDSVYLEIKSRYKHPFAVRSATLKALGSSVFDEMLTPTAQYRAQGRRNLRNRLPAHIKYVIDLTPPNEGDQAILLVSSLSCSLGVRQWGLSTRRWNISTTLVGGHDEFTSGDRRGESADTRTESNALNNAASGVSPKAKASPTPGQLSSGMGAKDADSSNPQVAHDHPPQLPEDYTPTRHRLAIERVLTVIEGFDPKLDSAIKVWTTFAVAQNFEIKHSSLTDYIVRWLRAPPNTYFIEVLPEVTLKIADGLQCEPLCRDVFSLLVGEKALAIACQERGFYDKDYNVHGRKKEDLSDGWTTRIEYASEELVSRVKSQFDSLVGSDMYWVSDLPELHQLRIHARESPKLTQAYLQLESLLKDYLHGGIWQSLCMNYVDTRGPLVGQPGGEALFHSTPFMKTWIDLRPQERIFTRSFWDMIGSSHFLDTSSNFDVAKRHFGNRYGTFGFIAAEIDKSVKAGVFRRVDLNELTKSISAYRTLSRMSSDSHNTSSTVESSSLSWFPSSSNLCAASTGIDVDQQSPPKRRRTELCAYDRPNILPFRTNVLAPNGAGLLTDCNPSNATAKLTEQDSRLEGELPIRNHKSATNEPQIFDMEIDSSTTIDHDPSLSLSDTSAVLSPPSYLDPQSSTHDSSTPFNPPAYTTNPSDLPSVFNRNAFFEQADSYIHTFANRMLFPPSSSSADSFELNLTDTLICLTDSELRFLPLWAGGNDDDTAGVYNIEVPIATSGFSTAGPSVHTGIGSSTASSDFEMLRDVDSTIDTSTVVNDGFSDTMDRRRVYDADSTWDEVLSRKDTEGATQTIAGDDATMESQSTWEEVLTPTGSKELEVVAEPNLVGKSSEARKPPGNGGVRPGNSKALQIEESYDDVFMGEEEPFEFDDDDEDELEGEGYGLQVETEDDSDADARGGVVLSYREEEDAWR